MVYEHPPHDTQKSSVIRVLPETLSPEQTDAVDKLSEVMNGDPRARLFETEASKT